jgi:hypothetical protein
MAYYRPSTTKLEWPVQVLNDAYIDTKRLIEMMDGLFPSGDYKARVSKKFWSFLVIFLTRNSAQG